MTHHRQSPIEKINKCLLAGICVLTTISLSFAQNIVNESNLYIPAGLTIFTEGSIISNGFIQNNGELQLDGDWINTNVYQGSGLITLMGTNQLLSNNNQAIDQLVIAGGGNKDLQGVVTITSKIEFLNGFLLVGAGDSIITDVNASATGGSLQSFVVGPMISKGSGDRFYPVGITGAYHPVEFTDVKGSNPVMLVEVLQDLPSIATDIPATMNRDIYWHRKTISGLFSGSPVTLGYDVASSIEQDKLIIATGEELTGKFTVVENLILRASTASNIVGTKVDVNGDYFAIGELVDAPPKQYYFSTTLSPNASNPDNRSVKIFGDNITSDDFYFQVFNRWGLVVFETKSYADMANAGWDGKQGGGAVVQSGVYPYSLRYVDSSGQAHQKTGFITVLN